jgi:hypothetical protein
MIGLSRIWRIGKSRCRPGGGPKDECGTMKDEAKNGGSQKKEYEAGRKEQVGCGTKAGMSRRTKEMPIYHRSIKVLHYPGPTGWRPGEKLGFKI